MKPSITVEQKFLQGIERDSSMPTDGPDRGDGPLVTPPLHRRFADMHRLGDLLGRKLWLSSCHVWEPLRSWNVNVFRERFERDDRFFERFCVRSVRCGGRRA